MKLLLTLFLPLSILFSACQKNEYFEVPNRTIVLNIAPTQWRTADGGKNYSCSLSMPEITDDFNERGGVLLYLSFGNRTYEQLPEVYDGIAYGYTTSPGQIELELQSSSGTGTINPPSQTITAKVVLVESRY